MTSIDGVVFEDRETGECIDLKNCGGSCAVEGGVDPLTGNKIESVNDYLGVGPLPLNLARTYNSATGECQALIDAAIDNCNTDTFAGATSPGPLARHFTHRSMNG